MPCHRTGRAGGHMPHRRGSRQLLDQRLYLLHPPLRHGIAVTFRSVPARVLVDLPRTVSCLGPELGGGCDEVVVIGLELGSCDALRQIRAADPHVRQPVVVVRQWQERQRIRVGAGRILAWIVDHDERVRTLRVVEIIGDPGLLHQPADEIECGFLELDAIVDAGIAERETVAVLGLAAIPEYCSKNIRHRLVLEDAAIRSQGQHPDPGAQFGRASVLVLAEPRHDVVDVPLVPIPIHQGDVGRLATARSASVS
jgi:hypothetical protein